MFPGCPYREPAYAVTIQWELGSAGVSPALTGILPVSPGCSQESNQTVSQNKPSAAGRQDAGQNGQDARVTPERLTAILTKQAKKDRPLRGPALLRSDIWSVVQLLFDTTCGAARITSNWALTF